MMIRHKLSEGPYKNVFVCKRWHTYLNFLADMGERPSEEYSIDRVDVLKGYSPDNCRWATDLEQGRNKRNTRWLEYNGERLCITEWAERLGMKTDTLQKRFDKGWSAERILTQPLRKVSRSGKE